MNAAHARRNGSIPQVDNTTTKSALGAAVGRWFESLEERRLYAFVTTDQADYHFGETALITGGEFAPNETVELQVTHVEGTEGSNADPQNQAWEVQTDAAGNFTATWLVNDPDALGASYVLTATGATGDIAQINFTDSIPNPLTIATAGNTTASTTLSSGTFSQAVAVGNTLIVSVGMDPNAGAVTITDTKGNTYTKDADVTNGSGTSGVRTLIFSAPITTALTTSDSITVTFATSTASKAVSVHFASGLLTASTKDQVSTATGSSTSPNTGATATTTQPDELLFAAIGSENKNDTLTPGASYTVLTQANTGGSGSASGHIIIDSEYRIVSATGAYSAGGTIAGAPWAAALVTYKVSVPTVVSINRASSTPTSGSSVSWNVTFSKSVTGVDAADFQLVATGSVIGASITGVTGSGANWTVTASTGAGDGTLGLNLVDNDSIKDSNNNPLGGTGAANGNFTGQVYTVDKANPSVTSIVLDGASNTNAASVSWTVVFSESVTGVDASDFGLATTGGISGASITGVSGSGTTYTVTANTGTGDGTIGLNLVDNDSIADIGANKLGGVGAGNGNFTGPLYTVDKIAPTVTINQAAGQVDPTNASPINFTVVFSEPVSGFSAVDVIIGGTANPTTVNVTGSGTTYNVAVSGMSANGTVTASVVAGGAQDSAGNGNLAPTSTDNSVTYDTIAPAAPVFTGIQTDTGASSTDNITSDPSLILFGTAEANSTVTITRVGTGVVGTTVADAGGIWSFDYTSVTLAPGTYSFTATAKDAANNTSATSLTFGVTIDTAAPAAPVITGITTDTGASSSDRNTSDQTLILSGTAEANSIVSITRVGTGIIGTATANGSGSWSFDYTGTSLSEGSHSFTATATDVAGNVSGTSATFTVTIDLTAPAAPAITAIVNDTGSSASDQITNDQSLILLGTADPNTTITVTRVGTGVIGTTTADGSGNWSFNYTATTLPGGTHNFTATAMDAAGNVSAASPTFSVAIDITAPAAPAITGINTDTGSSSSDRNTNDQTLVLLGTAEANSTVTVTRVGTGVIGTATADGSGAWSFDYTATTLAGGTHSFTATATDIAGNTSASSTTFTVTIDLTAPAAPVITGITTDTGSSSTDRYTSDQTLVLSGTAEANSLVTITRVGTGVIGTATANGAGAWSFDYTGTTLAEGSHSFTATATDAAGNVSTDSATFIVTIDMTPPGAPAITGIVSDTGSSNSDGITSDTTLVLNGTAEANSTVTITRVSTGVIGTATTDGLGNWSFNYTGTTLAQGNHSFTATSTDAAGNVSPASGAFAVVIDTTAPAAPAITSITTDTGSSATDRITNDQTLVLSGTAEANSLVTITRVGTGVIGTATANGAGAWSFDYTGTTLAEGSHTFTATATDTAGNVSAASASFGVTIDLTAPNAPAITTVVTDTGTSSGDKITSDQSLVLSGTAEANSLVTITRVGVGVIGTATADGSGNWTFDYTGTTLPAGLHQFTATATDAAGNTSAASATLSVTIDIAAPAAPLFTGIINDNGASSSDQITSDTSLVILGTAEASSIITVTRVGTGVIGTTNADGAGNWSFDYTGTILTSGSYSFTATARDGAGNTSGSSATFTVMVDTVAPAAPVITSITTDTGSSSTDRNTSDQTLILSGTAEANSTVILTRVGTGVIGTVTADGSGNWSVDYTGTTLAEGSYSFTATATDLAGNVSAASATFAVTVDLTPPAAPVITSFATDSGTVGDGFTNDNTLVLSGTSEANASIQVFDGLTLLGTTTATAGGAWSFTTAVLSDGSHSFTAKATDAAGNTGALSAPLNVTIDATAPAAPSQPDLADTSDTGGSQTDNVTFVTTPLFTGTAEANSTVTIFDGATSLGTTTADASGNWSFLTPTAKALSSNPGGVVHVITAKATDAAGNLSAASAVLNVTVVDQSKLGAVAVTNQAPKPVNPGGTASYDLTLTRGDQKNSGGNLNVSISVAWPGGVPTGVTVVGPVGSNVITVRPDQPVTTVIFRIATTAATPPGVYPFTITAGAAAGTVIGQGLLVVGFGADQGPNANNDSASTAKNTPVNINVTANDLVGPLGSAFTVTSFTSGANGIVQDMGGGVLKYTPVTNFTGTDTFTYTITDGNGLSDTALVTVFIEASNIAPIAVADSYTTPENTTLTVSAPGVLANDTDPDGNPITAHLLSGVSHGSLSLNANGSFTYTPTTGYTGEDSFIYYADDGSFNSNQVLVTITVGAVNDAPVNTVPAAQSTNEDTALVFSISNANAISISDSDADPLAVQISLSVTNGILTLSGVAGLTFNGGANGTGAMTITGTMAAINAALNGMTYLPGANYNGPVTLSITTNDLGHTGSGGALSDTDTVAITVNPMNDAPVAQDQATSTLEDTPVSITLVATDVDSPSLTYSILSGPTHGSLLETSPGVYTYTPDANYHGFDSFTFKANDGSLASNIATVAINVASVNDAPVADPQSATTNQNTPLTLTLTGSDIDADPLVFRISSLPLHGSLYNGAGTSGHLITAADLAGGYYQLSGNQVTYVSDATYFGSDTFNFKTNDASADSAPAAVSLTVNDSTPPLIVLGGSVGTEDDGQTQHFTWNVTDASGLASVSVVVTRNGATIFTSFSASGSTNFDINGLGTFEIVVNATDNAGNSSSASRSVIVGDDDTAGPTISLSGSEGAQTDDQTQSFGWNISDLSNLSAVNISITRNGVEVYASTDLADALGSFNFDSLGLGNYELTISATDADNDRAGDTATSIATRSVTVSDDDNAAPIITITGSEGSENDGQDQVFNWSVVDAGSGLGPVSVSVTKGGVEIFTSTNATGTFDFNSQGLGTFEITVNATDADGDWIGDSLSSSATRSVTVNDDDTTPPLIVLGGSVGSEDDGQDQLFTWNVTDAGSGIGSVSVSVTRNGVEIFTSTNATGSYDFNSQGLGDYQISVIATDADNDRSLDALTISSSRSVTVGDDDATGPIILITGSQGAENDGQPQSFDWTVSDSSGLSALDITITRDDGTGPVVIHHSTNLADATGTFNFDTYGLGSYQINISATDADADRAGDEVLASESRSVTVSDDDAAAPIITLGGSENTENDGQDQVFTWSVVDAGSGIGSVSVSVTRNGVEVHTSTAVSGSFDFNSLGLGDYQINVTATDADSDRALDSLTSTASRSVTVEDDDTAAPIITITGSEGSENDGQDNVFHWTITDAGSGIGSASIIITRDSVEVLNTSDLTGTFDFNSLGLGTYQISITATDADSDRALDSMTSTAFRSVTVTDDDAAAPIITLGGSENAENDGQDQVFTWSITDAGSGIANASVIITRDGVEVLNTTDLSGTFDFNALGLGEYVISVTATDADSDRALDSLTSTASRSVTVEDDDTAAPIISITGSEGSENDGQDQVFNWTVTDAGSGIGSVSVSVTRDGVEVLTSTNATGTFDFNSLGLGEYVISITTTDADSDRALDSMTSTASRSVTVTDDDAAAPVITLGGSQGSETDGQNQNFTWNITDAGSGIGSASVIITRDGVEVLNTTDLSGTFDFNSLGTGTYEISVTATDADSDRALDSLTSTASRSVTVNDDDSAAPIITLGGSEGSENDGQDQLFTWTVTDGGSGIGSVAVSITKGGVEIFSSTDATGSYDFNSNGLGDYQISVTATDADSDVLGDATTATASRSASVSDDDTAAPIITLGGSEGDENDGQDQVFTWNVTDAGSGLGSVLVTITRDGVEIHNSTDASGSFDFNSQGLGEYQINVTATDADSDRALDSLTSTASRTVMVSDDDTTPPLITLGGSDIAEDDGQDQVFTWDVSDTGSGLGSILVTITKNGSEIHTSTSPAGSFDFNSYGLGIYAIQVTATDADADRALDSLTSTASHLVVVGDDDTTPPSISVTGSEGSENDGQDQVFNWNVTDLGSGLGAVSVIITKSGVELLNTASPTGSFDFNSYGLGNYQITVSATDADGDWIGDSLSSNASRSATVSDDDITPPVIVLGGSEGDETDAANQHFTWNVTDADSSLANVTVSILKDGVEIYNSTNPTGDLDFNALGLGEYVINVTATDSDSDRALDSLTSTATRSVTVTDDDVEAPNISLGGSIGIETDGQNQVFTWTVTDSGSGIGSVLVTITRDDVEIHTSTDASGSFDFNSLGLGTFDIHVTAADADGDRPGDAISTASARVVVVGDDDTAAPIITLGGSSGAETDGQDQVFTWNVVDAGSGLGSVIVSITKGGVEIHTSTDASGSFDFNSLGLGDYQISVTATDADNDRALDSLSSTSSQSATIIDDDAAAPIITLGGSEGDETDGQNQHFTWSVVDGGSGLGSVLVTITKGGVEIHSSTDASGTFDFNSNGLGIYAINVTATDADDDRALDALTATASRTVTVTDDDAAAPIITITGSDGSENDGQDQVFNWTVTDAGSGIGSVAVSVTRNGVEIFSSTNPTGTFDFNSQGLGDYQIDITATDADNDRALDSLTSTASRSVNVADDDIAPPIITLGGSTGDETDADNQNFTWTITDAGSGIGSVLVTITRNGVGIHSSTDASGSFDFNTLGLGDYQITVTATDADSDRPLDSLTSTASRSVSVSDDDTAAPIITITGSEGSENDGQDQVFNWSVVDAGSGIGSVNVTVTRNGAEVLTSTNASGTFDFNALGLGDYQINVTATDADNDRALDSLTSTASRSVNVADDDIVPPLIVLGGSEGSENDGQDQHFTWTITDAGSGIGSILVTVTKDGVEILSSTDPTGTFDFNIHGLGIYQITATATDADSDRGLDSLFSFASRSVNVGDDDDAAPIITITGSEGTENDGQYQVFNWSITDAGSGIGSASVIITRDDVEILNTSDLTGTFDFNSLGLGTYEISITATDADSDRPLDSLTSTASRSVTVNDDDTAAPEITITGSEGSENDGQDQVFNWTVTDSGSGIGSVSVSVTRDGVEIFTSTNPTGTIDFNSNGLGEYIITVTATDADSDRALDSLTSTSSRSVLVSDDDTAAPIITITGSDVAETDGQDQVFNWNVTDAGSGLGSVLVTITKGGVEVHSSTNPTGSFDFNSLGLGEYTISVTATDADSDRALDSLTSTATRTVVVTDDDTQAPIITLGGSTGDETDGQDQAFTWNVTDAGSGLGSVLVTITRDGVEIHSSTDASGSFDFNSQGLGEYQISVTATDADSDRALDSLTSTASRSVIVTDDDTAAPVITLSGSDTAETDGANQHFDWSVTDAGSGLGSVLVTIKKGGVEIHSSTDASGSFDFNSLGLGTYTINVTATDADSDRALDAMTSTASRTVVVSDDDTDAPQIILTGSEGSETDGQDQQFNWNVSDLFSGLANVTVSITKGGVEIFNSASSAGTYDFNAAGLGEYVMTVSATDADADWIGDHLSASASRTVVVSDDDIAAPVILITGSTAGENDGQDQNFAWSVLDAGSGLGAIDITITRDDGTGPVVIYHSTDLVDADGSFDFNSHGLGVYNINISATDADGDRALDSMSSSASRSVTVSDDDTTAPSIFIGGSSGFENDGQDQVFTWDVTDGGSSLGSVLVTITRDGAEIHTSADASGSFDFNSHGLGEYKITVTATDADNDRALDSLSSTSNQTVTVSDDDIVAPQIILTGSEGFETDGQDQVFNWSVSDAGSGLGSVSVIITKGGVEILNTTNPTGTFDFNSLGLGEYTITINATDADSDRALDSLSSSASRTVVVSDDDITPPLIVLGGSTGSENDGQDQVFTWTVTDAGSGIGSVSVSITRNGVEIHNSTAASGSFDFNSLGLGDYEITVNATDADSDRALDSLSSSASRSVSVGDDDTAAPIINLTGSTDIENDGQDQNFNWNISDPGSGLGAVNVTITRDGVELYNGSNPTGNFDFNSLGLGTYTINISATDADNDRALDSLSNSATRTVEVSDDDTTPPLIVLGGSENSENDGQNQVFTWNVTDAGSGLGSVAVSVTRDGVEILNSTAASGTFDFNTYGLGEYVLHVSTTDADNDRALDALSSSATRSVTVTDDDTTPPLITLGGSSGNETDGQNQVFTWSVTDAGSGLGPVSVSVTRNGVEIFTSPAASGSFDFNSLGLGTYAITVNATDADNDRALDSLSSSGNRSATVNDDDTDAPVILTGGSIIAENDGQTQSFNWNISDSFSGLNSLLVTITRNGTDVIYSTSNLADAVNSFNFDSYGLGTYTLSISATDADNDRALDSLTSTATRTVTVSDDDTTPPLITLGGSTGSENDGQNQTFSWTVTDAGSGLGPVSVSITRNGVEIHNSTAASGSFDFNSYGLGTYEIQVSATDADNDRADDSLTSTASRSVTVNDDDTTPPLIVLGGSTGSENDGQNQNFTWTVTDAGSGIGSVSVSITRNGVEIHNSTAASGSFDFNSHGLGDYQITVNATDADSDRALDSLSSSANRSVTVSDDDAAGPVIILTGSTGSETDGQNQVFNWNITDLGSGLSSLLVSITRDGSVIHTSTNASGSFDFNSHGLGDYQITVTATDADNDRALDNLTSTASRSVTVTDDDAEDPEIYLGGSEGTESHSATQVFNWATEDDHSGLAIVNVTITKNGSVIYSGTAQSGSYNFDAYGLGNFEITVTATDADSDRALDSLTVTSSQAVQVTNANPHADAGDEKTANEGSSVQFNAGNSSDADGDGLSFQWDFGDGTYGSGMNPNHSYADNGEYEAKLTVMDSFGAVSTDTVMAHVLNVNPTPNITGPGTTPEGSTVNLGMSFVDAGLADTHTYVWHVTNSNGQLIADGTSSTFSFVPNDDGTYVVTLTVTDDDGGVGSATKNILVTNVAPTATNTGPQAAKQYSDAIVPVYAYANDPGSADVLTASIVGGLPAGSGLSLTWNPTTRSGYISGKANLAPATYNVDILISDDDGGSVHTIVPIVVTKEDALVTYSGIAYASTPSVNTGVATVTLRATIEDITSQFPGLDPDAGDIRNATVTFVNRDTGAIIATNVPVTLLNSGNTKVGIASYDWTVDIGSADSASFTIGIIVNNYYTRDSALDNTVVTVTKPITGAIGGGGYFINEASAGFFAGEIGLRTNFGFTVKFNKSGTSPQGNVNIIVRSYMLPNGTRDTKLHVYQIKSTAISSLSTYTDALGIRHATFVAKANIQDITNPLNVISIAGGLSLEMTVTDAGEPGAMRPGGNDGIGFTLWNGRTLWYSSNWTGTRTIEEILDGGNVQIRDGVPAKR